ncbi:uncharacterized protein LOC129789287 [Lutzomyia longipalpis]|uniref:uncharacterized protein LOC129789287 n=1 Tax=Lutzomyia longipalpis TaxID=7200 RepID=UPI0024841380|nr:uncharacterized protein LOC129789287 [Lutzomyia longipalpis]XP_055681944.1 uncharacterized protein LOC129789287 [Lutzomyia longipalpis]
MTEPSATPEVTKKKTLHRERGNLKRSLTVLESKLAQQPISHALAKSMITQVQDLQDRFFPIQEQLEDLTQHDVKLFEKEDKEATSFYERCMEIKIKAGESLYDEPQQSQDDSVSYADQDDIKKALSNQTNIMQKMLEFQRMGSSSSNGGGRTKLPQLSLPSFDGRYTEWPRFRDAFQSAIHCNNELKPNEKMQYLKLSLTGCAAEYISHVPISDDNYEPTWARLSKRYEKKGHLMNAFIDEFMTQSKQKVDNAADLLQASRKYRQIVDSMKALGEECLSLDVWMIYLMKQNMHEKFRTKWEETRDSESIPTVEEFFEFMDKSTDVLERAAVNLEPKKPKQPETTGKPAKGIIKSHHTEVSQCYKCGADHALYQCDQFKALSLDERRRLVTKSSLCYNCLRSNHSSKKCMSKSRCRECQKPHHTLLHMPPDVAQKPQTSATQSGPPTVPQTQAPSQPAAPTAGGNQVFMGHQSFLPQRALLPTALVYIKDVYGVKRKCRVLIDGGGECTMITEDCAQRLSLPRQPARIPVTGAGAVTVGHTRGVINMELSSTYNENNKINVQAYVMLKVTSELPSVSLTAMKWSHLESLQMADPHFKTPSKVDIILGAEYAGQIEMGEIIRGNVGEPIAKLTIFGWIATGQVSAQAHSFNSFHTELDLNDSLKKFWATESVMPAKPRLTEEEQLCESHFQETHSRDETGRYVVEFAFKSSLEDLGDSVPAAMAQFKAMERRFSRNPEFHQSYKEFMSEYISLGHMELVPPNEPEKPHHGKYLLPHQAVLRPSSETTKFRVVFNGSAPTPPLNVSFNDTLAVGPVLQSDLFTLLVGFRMHKFAFSADVVKMYRQIGIAKKHRDYLSVFWRDDPSKKLLIYRLTTVTYGTSSAPYLATKVLQQIANDYQSEFPAASQAIKSCFYMDDLLCGAATLEEAKALRRDIEEVLNRGCFPLRKWSSNSPALLEDIPQDKLAITPEQVLTQAKCISVLGLDWNTGKDILAVAIKDPPPVSTMRDYCSAAAKTFDPLGFISPVTIKFKMRFQTFWSLGLDWKSKLPQEVVTEYEKIQSQYPLLQNVEIPRIIPSEKGVIELHGFCDASERAYGAVVYAMGLDENSQATVNLVISKSRVAPLKPLSIPRLELNGCLVLAQMIEKLKESLPEYEIRVHAWTDSMVCLQWLHDDPRRWKTYVANRTSLILDIIPPEQWRHVSTDDNPADCISRGLFPEEFMQHTLWWQGPAWLKGGEDQWPAKAIITKKKTNEERTSTVQLFTKMEDNPILTALMEKHSDYLSIVRMVAYLQRFGNNLRQPKDERQLGFLTVLEQTRAAHCIFVQIQKHSFDDEYTCLEKGKSIPSSSNLRRLVPFLDEFGVMRVLGRLGNAQVSERTRHPILLPGKHPFIRSLVMFTHTTYQHAGNQLTMGILSTKYHILGLRKLVRSVTQNCIKCVKAKPRTVTPLMGHLPAVRVQENRPFYKSGCDFAGPFQIRTSYLRKAPIVKGYICLFICMVTKAVHLELVSDLSTEKFIEALDRFRSRRGHCHTIYCDNGSNFVGAAGVTREERLKGIRIHQGKVSKHMSSQGTQFHFIPPYSPTFGGLWERGIGNSKTHLKRVLGEQVLTFEEFSTVLCKIEACLNSRPLCAMSLDPEDLEPLTPAHFWLGHSLTLEPTEDFSESNPNRLSRWQLLQRHVQQFWKRWSMEYLTSLQQRPKWYKECKNLEVGNLVLLRENNLRPSVWKMGRITEVHPGKDGVVRAVTLKTKDGIDKRIVSTVAKLPVE